jgi:hypothetical protein
MPTPILFTVEAWAGNGLRQPVQAGCGTWKLRMQHENHAQAWQKKTYHRVLQSNGFKAQTSKVCTRVLVHKGNDLFQSQMIIFEKHEKYQ